MTRANTEQLKHMPWFAKAGAACSIVPIARFVGPNIFALKGGGYGCVFALTGIDEEGMTDLELDSRMRCVEGALRGLPEGSCLYQDTRVVSGFDLPRQAKYANPTTEVFASDRLTFLEETAAFRRIDLHWCLTLEPSKVKAFERKPQENAVDTSRMLAELEKTATILQSHLGSTLGLLSCYAGRLQLRRNSESSRWNRRSPRDTSPGSVTRMALAQISTSLPIRFTLAAASGQKRVSHPFATSI